MDILKEYTDAQVLKLADRPTPPALTGTWILTAPDGRTWAADSPMRCVSAEINDRVPPLIALARIRCSLMVDAESARREAFDTLPDDYECPH